MIVIGAGLSGCIAGLLNPGTMLLEAANGTTQHQAVLRFRSPQIGTALGIPFREVTVHKNVFGEQGLCTETTIAEMNLYARKVTGRLDSRSIADLRPVQRWIAPADFHAQLVQRLRPRIQFNCLVSLISKELVAAGVDFWERKGTPVISTMPLPALAKILGIAIAAEFRFAPIHVTRWRIPDCDAYQTVYYPSPETALYRATLTGEHLIAEAMEECAPATLWGWVKAAFGLTGITPALINQKTQRYGKIVPIDLELRKRTLYRITSEFGVYSLGRFALWSNILQDDVFLDLVKIRNMIALTNDYDLLRSHA
jgi:hypothetical protein